MKDLARLPLMVAMAVGDWLSLGHIRDIPDSDRAFASVMGIVAVAAIFLVAMAVLILAGF